MRKRIFEIIEPAKDEDGISNIYDAVMLILIVLSLIPLAFKYETPLLAFIDKGCACLFVLDYLLRLITADYKLRDHSVLAFIKYPFTFMAVIDLVSILPSFTVINDGFKVLRMFRMFRALRVLRIFKVARYSKNTRRILKVLDRSHEALIAVCSLAIMYVLISALIILNIEPESFTDFFEAVYWATVSLTTMGYGDIYPISSLGRAFTMVSAIFGIAIIALPAGIITAGYMDILQEEKKEEEKKQEKNGL